VGRPLWDEDDWQRAEHLLFPCCTDMNAWSGTAAGVTLGTDGTMTVFVRGSNSGESGVDGFFLQRVTIVYEGRIELMIMSFICSCRNKK
jgi:hypothetical protein